MSAATPTPATPTPATPAPTPATPAPATPTPATPTPVAPTRANRAEAGRARRAGWSRSAVVDAVVDATVVTALTVVATSALHGTFDGWGYLLVAALGAVLGVLAAAGTRLARLPAGLVVAPLAAAYLLVGPLVALRGSPSGSIPGPASARELVRVLVSGWKDLLTTLPPVATQGRLVALVLVIAMVGAAVGQLLARGTGRTHLPVLGPALTLAAAILLGVSSPAGALGRALVLALLGVVWGGARRRRLMVTGRGVVTRQIAQGAALLVCATAVTAAAAPVVGDGPDGRTILRSHVVAPVDLADHPSPLASFRRFRPAWQALGDETLLTVSGLPAGQPLRIATLDSYSGQVWAAGNAGPAAAEGTPATRFLRVGSRIVPSEPGTPVSATVTVAPAYAGTKDLAVWLPGVGELTRVRFSGASAWQHEEDLRYNPSTGAALLQGGLRAGDRYRLDAVVPAATTPTTVGQVGAATASTQYAGVTARFVALAAGGRSDQVEQVRAVAARLRTAGAYTDGVGAEARFLPGHSIGRLQAFLTDPEPAGNDEQYAAALALAAAQAGLPSRVVLAAVPDASGVVRGRDVRAWVEVQVGPRRWWSISPDTFVPPRDKKPKPRQDQEQDLTDTAIVPPPNATRPPSSMEQFILDSSSSARTRQTVASDLLSLPPWLVAALKLASVPAGALLLWALAIAGAKGVRRTVRRLRGTPAHRVAAGWSDVVDVMRDHRVAVVPHATRSEQVRVSGSAELAVLAQHADRLAFGPGLVDTLDAGEFWDRVRVVRRDIAAAHPRWERVRALLSPRSLLPPRVVLDPTEAPSAQHRRMLVS